jgi:hypothetical protein
VQRASGAEKGRLQEWTFDFAAVEKIAPLGLHGGSRSNPLASRSFPGKGAWPVVESTQLGSRSVAPIAPHFVHRLRCRSTLLLASVPHRAMASASLTGALWWQSRASQYIHTHEDCAAIWPSVGIGPGRDLGRLGFASSRLGERVRMAGP